MAKKKSLFNEGSEPELPRLDEIRQSIKGGGDDVNVQNAGLLEVLESLLVAGKIDEAKKMFTCRKDKALEAIKQFNPEQHKIMMRPDKPRLDKEDYETSKLPRAYQRITNQTGTFFMFGNKLSLSLANKPEEADKLVKYFDIFKEFLEEVYFDEKMYMARQITGAETECAKLYSIYNLDGRKGEVVCQLLSNGKGDTLYTIFNQYDKLRAFARGYRLRNSGGKMEEHFDVYTSEWIWRFYRVEEAGSASVWVSPEGKEMNPFGKIPVIYYNHEVDWEGSQRRIEKLEWRDSKHSDTVEYFGDPYLLITADIAENRLADAREAGKVMVMDNEKGRMEYVTPPENSELVKDEKDDLKASIDQDTMSPDWAYKSIMGLGTLSGEAMRRINLPGYVKRTKFAVGVYNELIRREINLLIEIACQYRFADDADIVAGLRKLKIKFAYTDPFIGGIEDNSTEIATLVGAGVMSIHAAVRNNRHVEDKQAEEDRIWEEIKRKAEIEAMAKVKAEAELRRLQQSSSQEGGE